MSRTLDQIRGTSGFRDLCTIVWDNSNTIPLDTIKKNYFLKRTNLQLMMEYCILSKMEMDESGDELDEGDLMIVEDLKHIGKFCNQEKAIQVCDDDCFMDIFNFFRGRDIVLEATILGEEEMEK